MDSLNNYEFHINESGAFMIGETEVRIIPGHSIFSFYDTDLYHEQTPKAPQKREKYYKCTHCSYTTAWSGSFKRHFMCRHTDVKPYACPECGYRTADIGNLKKHITARHTSERAFQCVLCPYGTINLSHLKRHVANQHVGERRYPCHNCSYAASQMSDLRKHVHAKHPDLQGRFETFLTDSQFSTYKRQNLKPTQTLDSNISSKPYGCFHCSFTCRLLKKLKLHMLMKHLH